MAFLLIAPPLSRINFVMKWAFTSLVSWSIAFFVAMFVMAPIDIFSGGAVAPFKYVAGLMVGGLVGALILVAGFVLILGKKSINWPFIFIVGGVGAIVPLAVNANLLVPGTAGIQVGTTAAWASLVPMLITWQVALAVLFIYQLLKYNRFRGQL